MPWDLAFAPDGAMLFTERSRGLSVRRADGSVARLFGGVGSVLLAGDFFGEGQSGFNGVAIDPDFANNRYMYVYMSSNSGGTMNNRVVRLTTDAGYTTVSGRNDLVTGISYKSTATSYGSAGAHSGGRIRFGPDGFLYIATGDIHNGPTPQDLTQLGGKILRVDRNGAAAPGNNTPSGDTRIYTYGHRNVQGLAFRPGTGRPYSAEHGPDQDDEVTPLTAGANAGWDPVGTCPDNYCGYQTNPPLSMTDFVKFPNAMRPAWTNEGDAQGMSGGTFLAGAKWKTWENSMAVGFLNGQRLDILKLDAPGTTAIERTKLFDTLGQRIRAVVQGPDQNLYLSTDGGEIWLVVPQ